MSGATKKPLRSGAQRRVCVDSYVAENLLPTHSEADPEMAASAISPRGFRSAVRRGAQVVVAV